MNRIEKINEVLRIWQKEKIRIFPCHTNRASEIGHPCTKYLVLKRTRWNDALMHDVGLQWIFDEGNYQEKNIRTTLESAGFEISQSQRDFMEREQNISGHIDGFISHPEIIPEAIPFEAKSLSPYNWASITDYKSMLNNKQYYIRKYPAQLQIYLYMTEQDAGLFILKNKTTGVLKFVEVVLDYSFVETLLTKAEQINKYVSQYKDDYKIIEKVPATDKIKICQGCCFRHVCFTDRDFGEGIILVDDNQIEDVVEKYENLKKQMDNYKIIADELSEYEKIIKTYFKNKSQESGQDESVFLCKNIQVKYKKGKRKKYEIPDEIKMNYVNEVETERVSIKVIDDIDSEE